MDKTAIWISSISLGISAVAIFISLFSERILYRFYRPKLNLKRSDDWIMRQVQGHGSGKWKISDVTHYYIRIVVQNDGDVTADGAYVAISEIRSLNNKGEKIDVLTGNLQWAGTYDPFVSIPPKIGRLCNLGFIVDPDKRELTKRREVVRTQAVNQDYVDQTTEIELTFGEERKDQPRCVTLQKGHYEIDLVVGSRNIMHPLRVKIELKISGDWFDDKAHMIQNKGVEMDW